VLGVGRLRGRGGGWKTSNVVISMDVPVVRYQCASGVLLAGYGKVLSVIRWLRRK
jgi:hypothetical protein